MQLRYISQDLLVGEAGGDPWAIDKSLQTGRPAQIADLAQAFHNASQCTKDADNAFVEACMRFEASWNRENGEHPINDSAEVQRATRSLGVQAAQLPKIAIDLENIAATLAEAQRTSTTLISTLDSQLQRIDTEIGQAIELEKNPQLSVHEHQLLDQHITQLEDQAIGDTKATLEQAHSIRNGYSGYLQKSLTNLRSDDGYDPAPIQALDAAEAPAKPDAEANRRQHQTDAFKQVFGRAPSSAADWDTAAALDPHSYDPKYDGVGPEVRVVKIRPVPGQGVVRVSQWIAQRDVTRLPPTRDFGDNRPANPRFNPENARVTTCIDYENGIVVMRQNPSVEQDESGRPGQVKVGVPRGSVTQTGDGAVRIKYDAGNPFAPIRNFPGLADHPWTVNGDLVFTPTGDGVRVDGTRTNYPSLEVYQDLPGGTTHTALIDPARAGSSAGPFANLPRHHDLGIGGRAFEPFDKGGWNPRYDVRVPLPSTGFGSAANPPSVPPPHSDIATPS